MKELMLILSLLFFSSDINNLNNPNWRTRQEAENYLHAIPYLSLPALEAKGVKSPDPETRMRSKTLVENYYACPIPHPIWGGNYGVSIMVLFQELESVEDDDGMLRWNVVVRDLGCPWVTDLVSSVRDELILQDSDDTYVDYKTTRAIYLMALQAGVPKCIMDFILFKMAEKQRFITDHFRNDSP